MRIPAFMPHLRVQTVPGDGVYLISEQEHRVLTGRLYICCAAHVNGRNSVDDIVDLLAGVVSPAEVYHTLYLMEKNGVIADAADLPPHRLTPFWTATRTDPKAAAGHLETAVVTLTVFGDVVTSHLERLLGDNRIRQSDRAALGLVITDDFLNPSLEKYNQEALTTGVPWLLVKPSGTVPAVGPFFTPGKTACWRCFSERNRMNRRVEEYVTAKTGPDAFMPLPTVISPGGSAVAFAMAVQEIVRYLAAPPDKGFPSRVHTFDPREWQMDSHAVDRLMNCPDCAWPVRLEEFRSEPPHLEPRPIAVKNDGGYRNSSPEETLDRLRDRISPVCGVISGISRNTNLAGGLYLYQARSVFGPSPKDGKELRQALMTGGTGKGMTRAQAEVSCLCEALECATLVFQGDEKRISASLSQLEDAAVHPNSVMLYSDRQLRNALTDTRPEDYSSRVPHVLSDDTQLEWSPIWSLTHSNQRFVPTESLYFDYRHPDGKIGTRYAVPTFNGTASGNCLEEAVLHGLFELVERDCIAVWWYNQLSMPGVDLESFRSPYVRQLQEYYRTQGRRLWLLDLTSDLGIPVFVAMSGKEGLDKEEIIFGFGCHLDAGIALHRALTEMNQLLAQLVLNPKIDPKGSGLSHPAREWLHTVTRTKHAWLNPAPFIPMRRQEDFPQIMVNDLLNCILTCRERIEASGLEVLVKDQTRADIKLSVATVIVPGLRHFWPRFASGRLYDVPVKLGWNDQPLTETDLNPIPFFL